MINIKKTINNDYLQQVLLLLSIGAFIISLMFLLSKSTRFTTIEILIPAFVGLFLFLIFLFRLLKINKICNEKNEAICEVHNIADYGNAYNITLYFKKDGNVYAKPFAVIKNSETQKLRNYSVVKAYYSSHKVRKIYIENLYKNIKAPIDIFSQVPGPTPYYYNLIHTLKFNDKDFYLQSDEHRYTFLFDKAKTYMIFEPDTNIKQIDANHLLLWYIDEEIHFINIDIRKFQDYFSKEEINNFYEEDETENTNRQFSFFHVKGNPDLYKEVTIPISGSGTFYIPEIRTLECSEELLLFARFIPNENQLNNNNMYCAVYDFNFTDCLLNIVPLKWYNEGSIDYSIIYPRRIVKSPDSRIYISGLEMFPIELDSSFNIVNSRAGENKDN